MLFSSLIVMIVPLEKLNVIYAQEQKNMPVVIKKVSFTTILTTAVITVTLKIYFVSIIIYLKSINSVQSNTKVIDSAHDLNILLVKETLLIKQKMPKLNNDLKAFKDLKFFK